MSLIDDIERDVADAMEGAPSSADELHARNFVMRVRSLCEVSRWLASRNTGLSSRAIVMHLTGIEMDRTRIDHPWDVYDFGRCVRLLDECPSLAPRIGEMATASHVWAALVGEWDALVAMYRADDSWDGRANKRIHAIARGER